MDPGKVVNELRLNEGMRTSGLWRRLGVNGICVWLRQVSDCQVSTEVWKRREGLTDEKCARLFFLSHDFALVSEDTEDISNMAGI